MDRVFSHSGDVGDLIAALPTIRALGGGHLRLFSSGHTSHPMTPQKVDSVASLLQRQSYLKSVRFAQSPEGTNLDEWRNHYRGHLNISDMVAEAFGVAHSPREEPWIALPDCKMVARVVIHRSARYNNHNFPWMTICEKYRGDTVFVGSPDEHMAFQHYAGPISYHWTRNYLDLASVIGGADLFIGNQSSPFWVAEGMKTTLILEVCEGFPNCLFERNGVTHVRGDGAVTLPDLD
jgi:hypothetical protein